MRAFIDRLKTHRYNLFMSTAKWLEETRVIKWLNAKPDTWYWIVIGAVVGLTLSLLILVPVDIIAFFKAFKKEEA